MAKKYATLTAMALCLGALTACGGDKAAAPEADAETTTEADATESDAAAASDTSASDAMAAIEEAAADRAKDAVENLAASTAFLTENKGKEGVITTDSGLQYEILSEGPADGVSPAGADLVDVHYVGTLIDGVEFDSSRARGAAARFPANQVIAGWIEGLQLMSVGDRYRFYIPPELAYGERGAPGSPIGPNQALIFDVELLNVVNPEINAQKAAAFLAENAKKDGVKSTESGLQYKILTAGPDGGENPNEASVVKVHYEGRLVDGTIFDSSLKRGEPVEFPLGRVIPGWIEGVQLMKAGDKFQFYIPPELAYGVRGTPGGPIGPNEALVFDVELLEVIE